MARREESRSRFHQVLNPLIIFRHRQHFQFFLYALSRSVRQSFHDFIRLLCAGTTRRRGPSVRLPASVQKKWLKHAARAARIV